MSPTVPSRARRRLLALPLLVALVSSWALEVGASLCTATSGAGADMRMAMDMASSAAEEAPPHHGSGEHAGCPPEGEPDRASCPFAIGGVGPCGATSSAPAAAASWIPDAPGRASRLVDVASGLVERADPIPLPPPRLAA